MRAVQQAACVHTLQCLVNLGQWQMPVFLRLWRAGVAHFKPSRELPTRREQQPNLPEKRPHRRQPLPLLKDPKSWVAVGEWILCTNRAISPTVRRPPVLHRDYYLPLLTRDHKSLPLGAPPDDMGPEPGPDWRVQSQDACLRDTSERARCRVQRVDSVRDTGARQEALNEGFHSLIFDKDRRGFVLSLYSKMGLIYIL